MALRAILSDIHALETKLLDFERKHSFRSETFFAAYVCGEEPEDESWVLDVGERASGYRTWLARRLPTATGFSGFNSTAQVWQG